MLYGSEAWSAKIRKQNNFQRKEISQKDSWKDQKSYRTYWKYKEYIKSEAYHPQNSGYTVDLDMLKVYHQRD